MPKIDAPTVAEHHSLRRAALLAAAADLLAAGGVDAVTLGAVGSAAGLARSSVYQYFDSAPALVAAVVEDAFPRALRRLEEAASGAPTPVEQVEAFMRTAVELATEPAHRSLLALGPGALPPGCRDRLADLHAALFGPLTDALRAVPDPDPELTARLLQGLLAAATRAVADGVPVQDVQRRTLGFVRSGLGVRTEAVPTPSLR